MIPLKHVADFGIMQRAVRIVYRDGALLRGKKTCNNRKKGGFSAAAGTYDGDKLAFADAEGDILESFGLPVQAVVGITDVL